MPRRDPDDPRWVRAIIEKPFGRSEASARRLNRILRAAIGEHQIYRIDHFLGKETVQNLLVFRFANAIFEPVWNRDHIHHVQITASETGGIGSRAAFYEEAGIVRDMFQNHLLSLLSLVAMEPPASFTAESVRDEKAKVLNAIRPRAGAAVTRGAIRGQYGPGRVAGKRVAGYREEEGVARSAVPSVVARTSTGRGSDRAYQSPAPPSVTATTAASPISSARESAERRSLSDSPDTAGP